jgi:hypothetical protein
MIKTLFKNNGLKRLGLFSFLSLSLLVQSCTQELEGVGGDLIPGSDLVQALETDTFTLQTKLVWVDSVRTDRLGAAGSVLIGSYEDDVFGRTSCAANIQFDRVTSSDVIPDYWTVQSVELDLAVQTGSYTYGDVKEMQYNVQQLTERLNSDSNYYAFSQVAFDATNLLANQNPQPSSEIVTEGSSTKNILRLQLGTELGTYLLTAGTAVMNDKNALRDYFKGLRVSTTTTAGRVVRYDMGSANTKMRVYYTTPIDPDDSNSRRIVQFVDFGISTSAGSIIHTEFYTQIERSLHGTSIVGIDTAGELDANDRILMQNGQLVCQVDYSSLVDFLRENPVLVHNVDFVAPVINPDNKEFRRPFFMAGLKDLQNVRNFYSLESAAARNVALFPFRLDQGCFRLDVTSFVRNSQLDADLSSTFYVLASNGAMAVSRVEVAGPSFDPGDRSRNMRLVVTYSERIEN